MKLSRGVFFALFLEVIVIIIILHYA